MTACAMSGGGNSLLFAALLVFLAILLVFGMALAGMGAGATTTKTVTNDIPQLDISEVWWDVSHGVAQHGQDFYDAVERLNACSPQVYFCGNPVSDEWGDTHFIAYCPLFEGANLCAGAVIGRLGKGFTAFPAPCHYWQAKAMECTRTQK